MSMQLAMCPPSDGMRNKIQPIARDKASYNHDIIFSLQVYGIGKRPTDIYSDNPLLILLVETCDAREQLVHLLDNLRNKCPEFKQLVEVIVDCLNLDYRRRITAPIVHEKFTALLQ